MSRQLTVLAALAVLIGAAFAFGYHKGTVHQIEQYEEDRQGLQDELLDLNEYLSVKNAEIHRLNREKEGLINELENQAVTAKGSDSPGVASTGGLQRLERRWGPSPTSP